LDAGGRAVYLDRDGVITENVFYEKWGETEGPLRPEDVRILPGAAEAMKRLRSAGWKLFLVSNQPAYAKGKTTLESLMATSRRVDELLRSGGARLDESYYSYTHPEGVVKYFSGNSLERKPAPYFLFLAAAAHGVNLADSWMVGDRRTDVQCGRAAGCRTVRIMDAPDETADAPDATARSLLEASAIILASPRISAQYGKC
jgi:D-glycero-D-manno-heptose 1,7-bisphosphate phosphatase